MPAKGQAENPPARIYPIPRTTDGVLRIQIGVDPGPELTEVQLEHVALFLGVKLGPTRVSLPGAIGF